MAKKNQKVIVLGVYFAKGKTEATPRGTEITVPVEVAEAGLRNKTFGVPGNTKINQSEATVRKGLESDIAAVTIERDKAIDAGKVDAETVKNLKAFLAERGVDDLAGLDQKMQNVISGSSAIENERNTALADLKDAKEAIETAKGEYVTLEGERDILSDKVKELTGQVEDLTAAKGQG